MSFLAWTFLFGSAAIAGPITAHLLAKPRFKRVPFTMLRFLRSGQRHSHSRRRLRDILILLLRCAIIVLIAVTFGQPILSVKSKPQEHRQTHFLAMDNSMSMSYQDKGRSLLDRMKDVALDRVRQAPADDVFNVYALASGQAVTNMTKVQAMAEIRQLAAVPASAQFDGFFRAVRQAGQTEADNEVVSALVLSDFSPSTLGAFDKVHEPTRIDDLQYESIIASEPIDNAAIVGAHVIDTAGTKLTVDITIANYGAAGRRTLTAQIPGSQSESTEVNLKAHRSEVFRLEIPREANQVYLPVEIRLSPKDNLAADDTYRVAVYIPPSTSLNVLLVHHGQDTFLFETAMEALSARRYSGKLELKTMAEDKLTSADFHWADVAVFASLPTASACHPRNVADVTGRGGRVIFFLTDVAHSAITDQLRNEGLLPAFPDRWIDGISYLNAGPVIGPDLNLDDRAARSLANYHLERTAVKGRWRCDMSPEAQCIWQFSDGGGLLFGQTVGSGSSILVNTSIDDSLGLLAKSRAWPAFCQYLLGAADRMQEFAFSTTDRPILHLPEAAPGMRPYMTVQVENCDGAHSTTRVEGAAVRLPNPAGMGWMKTLGEPMLYAGINLPEGETDVTPATTDAIARAFQRVVLTSPEEKQTVAKAEASLQKKPIWSLFAWAAIWLLLFESALANRLKR